MSEASTNFDFLQLYTDHMKSIKLRMQKIEEIVIEVPEVGSRNIPKSILFEFEFVCLQLRKVLEAIVQCSMISIGADYQRVHRDFMKHSRATNIVKNLDKLHRRWFPEFVYVNRHDLGVPYLSPGGSAFNKERWINLYSVTSEVIHVQNGFSSIPKLSLEFTIPDFAAKIKRHLSNHVTTQPNGGVFLCELGDADTEIVVSDCRIFGPGAEYFGLSPENPAN